ncbi:hypothetical protein AKJ41_02560 [candidate division MSBL1 archaeon SCGC-AAA259O05]|uniref:ABC3 transporter permease C-terminal domain-containing protein n=1 Tax=candidate division MSBL1 archaeon SCGC-AAA259O05 TaxID=1698271 RepID=A0A133V3X7_9EURY|nr:hypothetical protein AKJ41_02560 [candidate division MSBL1 archaeon SCGC-AAA259O05]
MRLLKFDYLDRKRILGMALIVGVASVLFATIALPILGFYQGFTEYLGEGENVVAIHQGSANTPFSGSVSARMASRASELNGVCTVSPEVIIPSFARDEPVFVRGVLPRKFSHLSNIEVKKGSYLDEKGLNSALVGEELAERLSLQPNERVVIRSAMAERYSICTVKGIFSSGSALDDEILVPLYLGQILRGVGHGGLTMVRIGFDREVTSAEELRQSLQVENAGEDNWGDFWDILPISNVPVEEGELDYTGAEEYMKNFLEKYGISRGTLAALALSVFLFAGAAAVFAPRHLVKRHEEDILVLRSIGASNKTLKIDMTLKLLPWLLLSSVAGLALGYGLTLILERMGYLRLVTHTVAISFDPLVILGLISATIVIALFGVFRAFGEVGEE